MAELNYHPQRSARGLATKRSGNIGFVLTDDHFSRSEPFYTKVFLGTEFEARKHDYCVLLTTVKKTFRVQDSITRFLLEKNVDGVILAGRVSDKLIDFVQRAEFPLVLIDYYSGKGRYSKVLIDNSEGARNDPGGLDGRPVCGLFLAQMEHQ